MLRSLSYSLCLAVVCIFCPVARSHEGHDHADDDRPENIKAHGVVFDDQNGNGRRDSGEPGIADVRVSNGRQIVKTNAKGEYELMISDDSIVFVIKPRNWMTPVNEVNLPQFFYIHKPKGSPKSQFPGVEPTGPLPDSIDFALRRQEEPDTFRALMFGDPQPRNIKEVQYIAHDVVEQIIAEEAHQASFGVTLGDIAFDDLNTFAPLNQAIALIGIPWYNVIGNHDINYDAKDDQTSDETFERHYGPNYYSFDHGPVHFMVLDDVTWTVPEGSKRGKYHAGLGKRQMEFIRNDLAGIPADQLVVLMMHIPLVEVEDRQELYRLIEARPFAVSISAHTHFMEHRFIGEEDGWKGKEKHHHIVNVTVCGSWWQGMPDERGIPHTTMKDGAPNGYSIMTFDGSKYSLEFRAAARPADHQMNLYAPEEINRGAADVRSDDPPKLFANVFNGSERTVCEFRIGGDSQWTAMQRISKEDPAYVEAVALEKSLKDKTWKELPGVRTTPHFWEADLPTSLPIGTHRIEVRATEESGRPHVSSRLIRVR
ncbi:MAG: calcineurin-like phosphoesterase family protein [Pirellulaceae bacterium]